MLIKARDWDGFKALMDELNAALREGFKANDAQLSAYWEALKDLDLSEVRFNVKRIIATATRDTPFPRPSSLRNKPASIAPASDPLRERAERENVQRWEELRRTDPVGFEIQLRASRAARAMTLLDEADPDYADLARELYRWNSLRYAPHDEQVAAVARYGSRHEMLFGDSNSPSVKP